MGVWAVGRGAWGVGRKMECLQKIRIYLLLILFDFLVRSKCDSIDPYVYYRWVGGGLCLYIYICSGPFADIGRPRAAVLPTGGALTMPLAGT